MRRVLTLLLTVVLCACSSLPSTIDATASAGAPPERLAFDDAVVPVASTVSEGQRMSYRRSTNPVPPPVPTLPVPILPTSTRIVETEIAVMPLSLTSIEVFTEASELSDRKATFDLYDEFDQPRVFRIVDERGDYYNVQVPMRPNGSTGWIRKSDVDVITTDQRILIDLSERSVIVWNGDEVVLDTTGTIGQPRTPTPTGSFYVRNVFEWYADSIYGPYVIPLSAYSESIDQINGGDAVVAIHGTQRPDLVGAAASLGCIRLDNDTLRQLAAIVQPGAPVDVRV